jgi:uncharacterized protein YgiM (DUF1202 family)
MRRVLFAMLLGALSLGAALAQQATISASVYQTTNLRSGPGTQYEIVGQLDADERVAVLGRSEDGRWLRVETGSGTAGWLPTFALVVEGDITTLPILGADNRPLDARPTVVPGRVVVTATGRVNVRQLPAIASDVIAQLRMEERAVAIARSSEQSDWLLIQLEENEGWVAYFTVRVEGDVSTLPVLVPGGADTLVSPSTRLQTLFNARLRSQPSLAAPEITVVPFAREVTALARTEDGAWLLVRYNEVTGWGAADLFEITDEALEQIPLFAEVTPEVRATATPRPS